MTDPEYTGRPELDALIDAKRAEQNNLDATVTVGMAEAVVSTARMADLHARQKTAGRRVSAARGLLTKAHKSGDAEAIAAARRRLNERFTEFNQVSAEVIAELHDISTQRLNQLGAVLDQTHRAWNAGDAVMGAIQRARLDETTEGDQPDD